MKCLKYLLIFFLISILFFKIYSYGISPNIEFVNNTNDAIRVTKGEFDSSKSDPNLNEVDDMFRNTAAIKPKSSLSYSITMSSLLSKKDIRVDASYEKNKKIAGEKFIMDENGFCKYSIIIYDNYTDIETSNFNICYKKLLMIDWNYKV